MQVLLEEANMQDEDGETALMHAILNHHQDCAELLYCEAGKQDAEGFTALMAAA